MNTRTNYMYTQKHVHKKKGKTYAVSFGLNSLFMTTKGSDSAGTGGNEEKRITRYCHNTD